jgi:predicted nucleic acid-binding protein
VSIGQEVAERASILRANYKLGLADAMQLAVSINFGCDIFLTNDLRLKKVSEVCVLILDELEL